MYKVTFHHWPDPGPWPSWLVWVFLNVPAVMRGWVMLILLYYFLVYLQPAWKNEALVALQYTGSQPYCMKRNFIGFLHAGLLQMCVHLQGNKICGATVVVIVCYRRCLSLKLRVSGSVCDWTHILLGLWVTRRQSAHVNQSICKRESKWLHSLSSAGQTYFFPSYWMVYSHLLFTSLTLPLSPSLSVMVCLFPSSPLTLTPRFAVFLCVSRPITAPTFL